MFETIVKRKDSESDGNIFEKSHKNLLKLKLTYLLTKNI